MDYKGGHIIKCTYILTGVRQEEKDKPIHTAQFCIAESFEKLEKILEKNVYCLSECNFFNYFVIEEYSLGNVYPMAREIKWFFYENSMYTTLKETSKPQNLKHVCNFGLS